MSPAIGQITAAAGASGARCPARPAPLPRLQRAEGRAEVTLSLRGGRTRLDDLYQAGSAKALLPHVHGGPPDIVFLNTSGGLTGGDRLDLALGLGPGAEALATTQTAERAYASPGGTAEVTVRLSAGAGARLHWLPQETILFDRSRLSRRTQADLGPGAELLFCESLVLGRAAMGEMPADFILSDWREIRREGRPVLIEPLTLTAAAMGRSALLGPHRAVATLALIAPGAEDALGPLRAMPPQDGVEAAASAWDGRCILRLLAPEAAPLRRALAAAIELLRGAPVPRVWQM